MTEEIKKNCYTCRYGSFNNGMGDLCRAIGCSDNGYSKWEPVEEDIVKHSYIKYEFSGIKFDPYRVMTIYGITHPALQHALKKLLCLEQGRNHKSHDQDLKEIRMALDRYEEMLNEG